MPRIFVALEVRLQKVLDLRDGNTRRRLKISEQRMLEADWRAETAAGREPLRQAIGRAVHAAGFEGLLVKSAADPKGTNLVVFLENLLPSSVLRVLDSDELSAARRKE